MRSLELSLGPLQAAGYRVHRSGIQWLCDDGRLCRANEAFAYCNISLQPEPGFRADRNPFASEREFQVAFTSRIAGRVFRNEGGSLGGYLDTLGVRAWEPSDTICRLEILSEQTGAASSNEESLRLQLLAGRRATGVADVLTGRLPGWHSHVRTWWCDEDEHDFTSLLSLGICDATGPIRGQAGAFEELFESILRPAHFVYVPNHPLTPCAPCLTEQLQRTSASFQAISNDLLRCMAEGSVRPTPDDWIFAGSLLAALDHSPISETYDLLTPNGLRKSGPPQALLLSLNAEGPSILRHKTLGYHLHIQRVYLAAAGPAVRAWLASSFETIKRSVQDIRRDYLAFFEAVTAKAPTQFLILNRMSTSGQEDISSYLPFDAPMDETLANIASKELNLMLHELSELRDVSIIDVDALAAFVGGRFHLPDGMHQSGLLERMVRAEIVSELIEEGDQLTSNSSNISAASSALSGSVSA